MNQLSTTLRPTRHRAIVLQDAAETESEGGIIIPEDAQRKETTGVVLAVGTGRVTDEGVVILPDVEPGDRIRFDRFAGISIDDPDTGEELVIINQEDISLIYL